MSKLTFLICATTLVLLIAIQPESSGAQRYNFRRDEPQFRPPNRNQNKPGSCPPSNGFVGACVFDPTRNCLSDSACSGNLKCCSAGCGRECKSPNFRQPPNRNQNNKPGTCPPSDGSVGICVFDPNRNCLGDSQCSGNQKCCSQGCGRECKTPAFRRG